MLYHLDSPEAKVTDLEILCNKFISNMYMAQVDTLCVGRYWSEVLCCTITKHLSDLEVNVMGHRFIRFSGKAQVRRATLSCDSSYYIFILEIFLIAHSLIVTVCINVSDFSIKCLL